jgi:hypothetical protein
MSNVDTMSSCIISEVSILVFVPESASCDYSYALVTKGL